MKNFIGIHNTVNNSGKPMVSGLENPFCSHVKKIFTKFLKMIKIIGKNIKFGTVIVEREREREYPQILVVNTTV